MARDRGAPARVRAREPRLRGRPVRVPPALLAEAREESARSRLCPARASLTSSLAQTSSHTCSACSRARGAARSAATTPTPRSDSLPIQVVDRNLVPVVTIYHERHARCCVDNVFPRYFANCYSPCRSAAPTTMVPAQSHRYEQLMQRSSHNASPTAQVPLVSISILGLAVPYCPFLVYIFPVLYISKRPCITILRFLHVYL